MVDVAYFVIAESPKRNWPIWKAESGPSDRLMECISLSRERTFEATTEGSQSGFVSSSQGGTNVPVDFRHWAGCVSIGTSLAPADNDEWLREKAEEMRSHIIYQATNRCEVAINTEGLAVPPTEPFIVTDRPRQCVVYELKVDFHILSVAETADYQCYSMWLRHLDSIAQRSRKRVGDRHRHVFAAREDQTRRETMSYAERIPLPLTEYCPVEIIGDRSRSSAVICFGPMFANGDLTKLYVLDAKITPCIGTKLMRTASVRCGNRDLSVECHVGTITAIR